MKLKLNDPIFMATNLDLWHLIFVRYFSTYEYVSKNNRQINLLRYMTHAHAFAMRITRFDFVRHLVVDIGPHWIVTSKAADSPNRSRQSAQSFTIYVHVIYCSPRKLTSPSIYFSVGAHTVYRSLTCFYSSIDAQRCPLVPNKSRIQNTDSENGPVVFNSAPIISDTTWIRTRRGLISCSQFW